MTDLTDSYFFRCPHCLGGVQVLKAEMNCKIFRHGQVTATGEQINPHLAKAECDRLAAEGKINGCGKPFRFVPGATPYVEECGYI